MKIFKRPRKLTKFEREALEFALKRRAKKYRDQIDGLRVVGKCECDWKSCKSVVFTTDTIIWPERRTLSTPVYKGHQIVVDIEVETGRIIDLEII